MVNLKRNSALILAAAFLFSGCAVDRSMESKKIIEKDNGKLVELTVGNTLIVELPGNPSTGYMWQIVSVDTSVLKQVESATKFKADTKKLIGSPGKVTMLFKAAGQGKTMLKLAYHRSWEKKIAPLKTYQVDVIVN
ncbi:MAG: protease inhibitor I42 family protein [Candidatus Omnitrophica bacterium]|nr:protease inhibitor I42 family protein [Candidatus Omnitrophota bacterium]